MCQTCGCGGPKLIGVEVSERLLAANDRVAAHNREHFAAHRCLALNVMGSPGSGKTALLEATARAAARPASIAALAGDLATARDAERLERAGVRARAITTGTACHLDAEMVHDALHELSLDGTEILFIENVGNLVCPAIFDLGQAANVVVLSVTEGEDKPLKYPVMFHRADLVLVTKVDLLPHLPEVRIDAIEQSLRRVTPAPALLPLSARSGEGVDRWMQWLRERASAAG